MKNFTSNVIPVLLMWFAFSFTLNAQNATKKTYSQDPLFPSKNNSLVMAGTGIPFLGIAEYTYGFSNKFSAGILVGRTPIVPGYGIRIKGILYQKNDNFRVTAKTPILYYPATKDLGAEPWVLAWPTINTEWKFDSGIRVTAGAGIVAAACLNSLLGLEDEHHHIPENTQTSEIDHSEGHHHSTGEHHSPESLMSVMPSAGFMGDVWNTIQTSVSIPIGNQFLFQSEIALVFDGTSLADKKWIGRYPVVLFMGVSYEF
jgi:hypothetical protein